MAFLGLKSLRKRQSMLDKSSIGSPVGVLTPDFIGQRCQDTTTGLFYVAQSLSVNGWALATQSTALVPGDSSAATRAANTALLQAAFNAANGNTQMTIQFAEGDIYLNAGSLEVKAGYTTLFPASTANNVLVPPRLIGAGATRTRLRFVGSGVGIKFYAPRASSYSQMWNTLVRGISFYGPGDLTDTASCALQFGGVDASGSNVMFEGVLEDVHLNGWYVGTRHDDCTQWRFSDAYWENCTIGAELAYNCDVFRFTSCSFGDQSIPVGVSCATNSTTTITGIAAATWNVLKIGMYVMGANIPADTRITALPTSGTITISNAATATNASDSIDFALMVGVFVTGTAAEQATVAWPSAWTPAYNTSRGNQNDIQFDSCWVMRTKALVEGIASSSSQYDISNNYFERGYQCAIFSNSTQSGGPKSITIRNNHFSQPQGWRYGGVFEYAAAAGGSPYVLMTDNRTDGSGAGNLPKVYWFKCNNSTYNGLRFLWERNQLPWDSTVSGLFGPINMTGLSNYINVGDTVRLGTPQPGGYTVALGSVGAGSLNWDAWGVDVVTATITGNYTINNPSSTQVDTGRDITFIVTEGGAGSFTLTFGTAFVTAAGARVGAAGVISGGAAGTKIILTFTYDGSRYVQKNGVTAFS